MSYRDADNQVVKTRSKSVDCQRYDCPDSAQYVLPSPPPYVNEQNGDEQNRYEQDGDYRMHSTDPR